MNVHKLIKSIGRGNGAKGRSSTKDKTSLNDALNQYGSMNEEQLMAELFKKGSLSNGKVSEEELDSFYNNALPYLTKEQAEKMRNLIIQLKNS